MKVKLFLIFLAVVIGRAEAVADEADGSADKINKIKPRTRKCNMERFGMCPEKDGDDNDDFTSIPEKKVADGKAKCINFIAQLGRMGETQKWLTKWVSKFATALKKSNNKAQQT